MEDRFAANARIVVETSCLAKPGESVLILTRRGKTERRWNYSKAFAAAAVDIGAVPAILDISEYVSGPLYEDGRVAEPIRAAVEAADVVISVASANFGTLVGDPDWGDRALAQHRRWVSVQYNGMEEWDITSEEVAAIRRRTMWLIDLLESSQEAHVSSPAGTDFTFGLGDGARWHPILGIVPLYGEVAIIPQQGTESGIFIVDGPTQMGVRTRHELEREPIRIAVESGRVVDVSGDAEQVERLEAFIAGDDPQADAIDEVGVVTTTIEANDRYWWESGTHHHDTLHIALGNNPRRDELVHGPRHMDGEVCRPTVTVGGTEVLKEGIFNDDVVT